jgi:3'-phosphoadenosine 5'-phosphosulfate sulfotransferase (PAPS reductase)/FAD synthetase
MILPKGKWRWIIVNSSAGKDSQTALALVIRIADAQGYPRSQIVVSHQCLGDMEWPGTLELARKQAESYGLRFEVTRYRNKEGENLSLLDYVRKRGKWPDNKNRYCTSDFKRSPGGRVITQLFRESPGDILNVFGFRAEESPARRKKSPFVRNDRFCTQKREVYDWLPIHDWTAEEVWTDIRLSGIPYHPAYDLGMPRLSCVFCVFAPKAALMIAAKANPGLFEEYLKVEDEIGHTFQNGYSLREVHESIELGQSIPDMGSNWVM